MADVPLDTSVPQPAAGFKVHVTPPLAASFVTVAEKFSVDPPAVADCCAPPAIETDTGLTVTCTEALLLASAAEVAVIVAVQDAVKADDAGAVYVTEAPLVADSVPHPVAGLIAQLTPPLLLSFATVAVNAKVPFPVSVWGAVCESATERAGLLLPPPQLVMETNERHSDSNNTTTRVRRLMGPVLLNVLQLAFRLASSPTSLHAWLRSPHKGDPKLRAKNACD